MGAEEESVPALDDVADVGVGNGTGIGTGSGGQVAGDVIAGAGQGDEEGLVGHEGGVRVGNVAGV